MEPLGSLLSDLLGLDVPGHALGAEHLAVRAVVTSLVVLAIVRVGGKRFIGRSSAHDLVLAIVLGSVASKAMTGAVPFFPGLAGCVALGAVHWVLAWASYTSKRARAVVEGDPDVLLDETGVRERARRRNRVTREDLEMACREHGLESTADARRILLERNGQFSVLPSEAGRPPRE